MAGFLAGFGPIKSGGEPLPKKESSFFVYLNDRGGWCALRNRAAFVAEVNSDKAAAFESDQGQVWIAKNKPTHIEEFRMDAEGEWSLLATYTLDDKGYVAAARVVERSGEPPEDKAYNFEVVNGTYLPNVPKALSANMFRAATKLHVFPFSHLIDRFIRDTTIDRFCDKQ